MTTIEEYKKIVVYAGDEYRAKVDDKCDTHSFFIDVYKDAIKIISGIVRETKEFYKEIEDLECVDESYIKAYGNNVVVVVGKRGEGKTTALQTISKILASYPKNKPYTDIKSVLTEGEVLGEKLFFDVLDSIDPSVLNEKSSLVRVFLSKLFYRFNSRNGMRRNGYTTQNKELYSDDCCGSTRGHSEEHLISEIYNMFSECGKLIAFLEDCEEKCKGYDGNLEEMFANGNSTYLQQKLYYLVKRYLQWMFGDDKCKSNFLVVQIDDADLSDGNIYKMCKDIHYFLRMPQVIVIFGMNIEQVQYFILKEKSARYSFKEGENYYLSQKDEIEAETGQFIEKVFPSGNRLILPKIMDFIYSDLDKVFIEYKNKDKKEPLIEVKFDLYKSMYEQISYEIYVRTGLLLCINKKNTILPTNMRELTHLLKILQGMEEVNINEIDKIETDIMYRLLHGTDITEANKKISDLYKGLKRNINEFRKYIFNDVFETKLTIEEQDIVRTINKDIENFHNINVKIHSFLKIQYKERNNDNIWQITRILEKVFDDDSKPKFKPNSDNYNEIYRQPHPELAEFIKVYYSICLSTDYIEAKLTEKGEYLHSNLVNKILVFPQKYSIKMSESKALVYSPIDVSKIESKFDRGGYRKYKIFLSEDGNTFNLYNAYDFVLNSNNRNFIIKNIAVFRELFPRDVSNKSVFENYIVSARLMATNMYILGSVISEKKEMTTKDIIYEIDEFLIDFVEGMNAWARNIASFLSLGVFWKSYEKNLKQFLGNILMCQKDNKADIYDDIRKKMLYVYDELNKALDDSNKFYDSDILKESELNSIYDSVIKQFNIEDADVEEKDFFELWNRIKNFTASSSYRRNSRDMIKYLINVLKKYCNNDTSQ